MTNAYFCAQYGSTLTSGSTVYTSLASGAGGLAKTTENQLQITIEDAGIFSNLNVFITLNSTATTAGTLKYRVGAAPGNETITIPLASSTGNFTDATHTDSVTAGNQIDLQLAGASSGSLNVATLGAQFAPTTANNLNHLMVCGNALTDTAANTTYYNPLSGLLEKNTTEANAQFEVQTTATLQNLYVFVSANTAAVGTITSRVGAAPGNLTVTLSSGVTGVYQDTTHNDALASGNLVNTAIDATALTTVTITVISVDFLTTNSNTHYLAGISVGSPFNVSTTANQAIAGYLSTGLGSLAKAQPGVAFTASNLESFVSANTITANSTIRFQFNLANGNQVLTYGSGITGYLQDSIHTDSVTTSSIPNYSVLVGGTGTSITVTNMGIEASYPAAMTALSWDSYFPDFTRSPRGPIREGFSQGPLNTTFQGNIFPDKWLPQIADFTRRPSTPLPVGQQVGPLSPIFKEAINVDKWIPNFPDFTRRSARPLDIGQQIGAVSPAFKETVQPDKWMPSFPDFARKQIRALDTGHIIGAVATVFKESIFIDKWLPVFSDYLRKPFPLMVGHQISALATIFKETIYPDKWMPSMEVPRPLPRAINAETNVDVYTPPTVIVIFPDRWMPSFPDILRKFIPLMTGHQAGPQNIVYSETINYDKWGPNFPDFTRKPARPLDVGVIAGNISPVFKENILPDKWMPQFVDIARRTTPLMTGVQIGPLSTIFAETVNADKWLPRFPDTTRKPAPLLTGHQIGSISSTFHENVLPDKWMPSFPDILRKLPRALDVGAAISAVATIFKETVNYDKWGPSFPDFARRASRPLDTGISVSAIGTQYKETIDYDKWGPHYPDFARRARRPLDTGFVISDLNIVFKETIYPDKWEPQFPDIVRRQARALDTGMEIGDLDTHFKPEAPSDSWIPSYPDIVRASAGPLLQRFDFDALSNIVWRGVGKLIGVRHRNRFLSPDGKNVNLMPRNEDITAVIDPKSTLVSPKHRKRLI